MNDNKNPIYDRAKYGKIKSENRRMARSSKKKNKQENEIGGESAQTDQRTTTHDGGYDEETEARRPSIKDLLLVTFAVAFVGGGGLSTLAPLQLDLPLEKAHTVDVVNEVQQFIVFRFLLFGTTVGAGSMALAWVILKAKERKTEK